MNDIVHFEDYFKQKSDALGKPGFSPHVKMIVAFHIHAYRYPIDDAADEYLKIEATTSSYALLQRMERSIFDDLTMQTWLDYLEKHSNEDFLEC